MLGLQPNDLVSPDRFPEALPLNAMVRLSFYPAAPFLQVDPPLGSDAAREEGTRRKCQLSSFAPGKQTHRKQSIPGILSIPLPLGPTI